MGTQMELRSLPAISWLGMRGMTWDQVLPAQSEAMRSRCQLEVLVLHLRENDFVSCSEVKLLFCIMI